MDNKRILCYLCVKILYFFCCIYVDGTHITLDTLCALLSLLIRRNDISVCTAGPLVTCIVSFENWMN